MRSFTIAVTIVLFLSSCLKESIPEAMLNKKNGPKVTATFSCKVNGAPATLTVEDVANQGSVPYRTISCTKQTGTYDLFAMLDTGPIDLYFFTDTLTLGNYRYTTADVGQQHVIYFSGQSEFLQAPADYISINVTSYNNGYISGNFSALLTPMVDGNPPYKFGTPSSISVTEGSFNNVPVFY